MERHKVKIVIENTMISQFFVKLKSTGVCVVIRVYQARFFKTTEVERGPELFLRLK